MSHARLSAAECAALMREQGHLYLDVRTEEEFEVEHAAGAYNVPWNVRTDEGVVENTAFVAVVSAAFARDQGLVVGCREGRRSRLATSALIAAGFTRVVEQRAGHAGSKDAFGRVVDLGWAASGLPCASEPEPGHDYEALLASRDAG